MGTKARKTIRTHRALMLTARGRVAYVGNRLTKMTALVSAAVLALILLAAGKAQAVEAVEAAVLDVTPRPPMLVPPQLDFSIETAPGYNPKQPCLDAMSAMSGSGSGGAGGHTVQATGGIDHAAHHRQPGDAGGEAIWTEQDKAYVTNQLMRALAKLSGLMQEISTVGLGEAGGATAEGG
ncbi:MAG: hypothetical protein ACM3ZC_16755 [Bacteroidota bacterium]